jgi:putative Holliday junction resolvase
VKYCKPKSKSILSLDVGIKRIGLAYCDSLFITVNILPAVKRERNNDELNTIKNT